MIRKWSYTDTVYNTPNTGLRLHFEFISRYRRVIVVEEGNGFELRVSYKGLSIKPWVKRYGVKEDAVSWAKTQAANVLIVMGCVTLKDYNGIQII